MYHFVLAGEHVVDFFGLIADARQRATGPGIVVHRTAVVMAELHDDEVARLQFLHHLGPQGLVGVVRPAARAAQRMVFDVQFLGIEIQSDGVTPAPLSVGAVAASVPHGRVADEVKGRFPGGLLLRRLRIGLLALAEEAEYHHQVEKESVLHDYIV